MPSVLVYGVFCTSLFCLLLLSPVCDKYFRQSLTKVENKFSLRFFFSSLSLSATHKKNALRENKATQESSHPDRALLTDPDDGV